MCKLHIDVVTRCGWQLICPSSGHQLIYKMYPPPHPHTHTSMHTTYTPPLPVVESTWYLMSIHQLLAAYVYVKFVIHIGAGEQLAASREAVSLMTCFVRYLSKHVLV